jgi:hypothetical protein
MLNIIHFYKLQFCKHSEIINQFFKLFDYKTVQYFTQFCKLRQNCKKFKKRIKIGLNQGSPRYLAPGGANSENFKYSLEFLKKSRGEGKFYLGPPFEIFPKICYDSLYDQYFNQMQREIRDNTLKSLKQTKISDFFN